MLTASAVPGSPLTALVCTWFDASAYAGGKAAAERVQAVRRAVKRLKIRHTVSMRATIKLAKLLTVGDTKAEAEAAALWKSLDDATITKIEADIKANA